MTPEAVLNLITAVAIALWLVGLIAVVRAGRRTSVGDDASTWWAAEQGDPAAIRGSAVLPEEPPPVFAVRARDLLAGLTRATETFVANLRHPRAVG